jgi:hypothetical protein
VVLAQAGPPLEALVAWALTSMAVFQDALNG